MGTQRFVVEYLSTNRYGGLVDKVSIVRATSAQEARAKFIAKNPTAAVGFVGLDDDEIETPTASIASAVFA